MRSRDIKPGFFKNDQLAECSMTARLLFPGLWMLADREGRLENRPKKIKGEIFPFDNVDVASLLAELEQAGLIRFYEVNGQNLIWIPQFKKHQSPHKNEKQSEFPAHPDDISTTCQVHKDTMNESTPERAGSCPEITEQIPLTPSSLTSSSLSPRDLTTPDGVVADAVGVSPPTEPDSGCTAKEEMPSGEILKPVPMALKATKPVAPPCPHKQIVALYHEVLPTLPRVKVWDSERERNMQARWRERWESGKYATQEEGLAYWRRLFTYIHGCPWLMGEVADRDGKAFRADLGWIILPRNFKKIIEGRYDQRQEVA